MLVQCEIEKRKNKEGKEYECLVMKLDNEILKPVFGFSPAELKLLRMNYERNK